ncbi:unnamed protein product [Blepharisma stoltei]|uniref:Uncharacterized protein n=1 Tax=Blepharisma stoltei TaxID=1481888 RepID=A0AAU9IDQ1_9CILI|nr:unnamed protein product [Blepharisma stoltei]
MSIKFLKKLPETEKNLLHQESVFDRLTIIFVTVQELFWAQKIHLMKEGCFLLKLYIQKIIFFFLQKSLLWQKSIIQILILMVKLIFAFHVNSGHVL